MSILSPVLFSLPYHIYGLLIQNILLIKQEVRNNKIFYDILLPCCQFLSKVYNKSIYFEIDNGKFVVPFIQNMLLSGVRELII